MKNPFAFWRRSGAEAIQRGPTDERTDALSELHKSYLPPAADPGAVAAIIDWMQEQAAMDDLLKAGNPTASKDLVPYPPKSRGERGMQSVVIDDFTLQLQGDYIERPGILTFEAMRKMVASTPILNAAIFNRSRKVAQFCRINESGEGPGYTLRHKDKDHELTSSEQASINLLNGFFEHCGWESNPRRRKILRRDSFSQFMQKSVRDSMVMDSAPIELELKNDIALGIDGIYAVDGATIRLCSELGYRGDDEIFALQVVQGRIRTAYTRETLIYEPRNPQTDVLGGGYGIAEVELMIKLVTGFLNAMTYNQRGFDENSIPKGLLHLTGNYSDADMAAFKRYWNSMVKGVNNAFSLPVLVSKDQESKASFERFGVDVSDIYFSKWMTFLTSIICAIWGFSPEELNFESFTSGKSPLAGSDTSEKLADAKEKGLKPILYYYESLFTDYVLSAFDDKYVFRWTGLDDDDRADKKERQKLVLTVNEMRAMDNLEALDGPLGDAPLNPSLMSVYLQTLQQQQPQEGEQGGDFGQPQEDGPQQANEGEQPAPADEKPDFGNSPPDFGGEQQADFGQGEQDFGKSLSHGNPYHDHFGRFTSIFSVRRKQDDQRGKSHTTMALTPEHIERMAEAAAELLMNTPAVALPTGSNKADRKRAVHSAKVLATKMREQGLAIRNHGSGALIELSGAGLDHAKSMSGDIRCALLLYKLPAALSRAVYFKSEKLDPRKSGKPHLVAYHKFAVPILHHGAMALAVMHIEEDVKGHFYYDASVTPEIDRLGGKPPAGGPHDLDHERKSGLHRAYYEHIKHHLEVKPGLGEIHTFFRKSLAGGVFDDDVLAKSEPLDFGVVHELPTVYTLE